MEGPMYPPEYMIDDDYQLAEHFLLKGDALFRTPPPRPDFIREQAETVIDYWQRRCHDTDEVNATLRQQVADAQAALSAIHALCEALPDRVMPDQTRLWTETVNAIYALSEGGAK